MSGYHLRKDITRERIGDFWLPLGLEPGEAGEDAKLPEPEVGYSVSYTPGTDDAPDMYVFSVVVSHDQLKPLLDKAFGLLPDEVSAIVEIGSRDAYRPMDEFISVEPITRERFLSAWSGFEPILLEDCAIAGGANSEEPFVEVFLDHLKGFVIHVPPSMRDEAETLLSDAGLDEIEADDEDQDESGEDAKDPFAAGGEGDDVTRLRPVLDLSDDAWLDLDDVLLELRRAWNMELNVDADRNFDSGGRDLGMTLWHGVIFVQSEESEELRTTVHVWATSDSLVNVIELIRAQLDDLKGWRMTDVFTLDRVAFDERPDELADLPPRQAHQEIHLIEMATYENPAPSDE